LEAKVVRANEAHAVLLAASMRSEDEDECIAAGYASGLHAAKYSVSSATDAWAVFIKGELLGVFGVNVSSVVSGKAVLWLLTTTLADRRPKTFVYVAMKLLDVLKLQWPHISVGIGAHHIKARRFAKGCGFKCGVTYADTKTGEPFVQHTMEA